MPKLTAGIRVKNSELWAEECLSSLSRFADEVVILDDGSTDRTVEICRGFPKVTRLVRWPKSFFHEGIDRNVVLALAKDTEPDWIVFLDIDEVFEDRIAEDIQAMMSMEDCGVWGFHMLHFWRSRTHFRVDGQWGQETLYHIHPRLVRNVPGLVFPPQMIHGAHVLGTEGRGLLSGHFIKHYGYAYADEVARKYERYRQLDPQGDYEHLRDESSLQLVPYEQAAEYLNRELQKCA
jgi:glycosyltransferase involved in cell wall biosynthesis